MDARTLVERRGGGQELTRDTVPGSKFRMKGGIRSYEGYPEEYRREHSTPQVRRETTRQFLLENPRGNVLNTRGRYELRSGRAFFKNANGTTTLGGRLRGSILLKDEETLHGPMVRLYAGGEEAYYAIYQELGTRHHPAHPFLRPALDEASKYFPTYVRRAISHGGL
jgi:HK97 gp10 family phage protein